MLDLEPFLKFLELSAERYSQSAPTVANYIDDLYIRVHECPAKVILTEILRVGRLYEDGQWLQPNYAANLIYKLENEIGRDTTGCAGF